jgi:hypothetical protein
VRMPCEDRLMLGAPGSLACARLQYSDQEAVFSAEEQAPTS